MATDVKPCLENLPVDGKTIIAGYVHNFTEEDEIVDCCSPVHVSQSWLFEELVHAETFSPEFPSVEEANLAGLAKIRDIAYRFESMPES
jgi:hypothetical protein